ncbi:MAG TPA: ankyrin repeat domain-containing protein [Pyrinomonadaceae bacterium]|jgi:ankyrin repeat protein|nr:ankyrin repeat domain-containing protein [Pyrinomonadaceae bacterium]
MRKPVEMETAYPIELHDGVVATTIDVWEMLNASLSGDLRRVSELVEQIPGLLTCQFDYTSPIHFAVREGHYELVRYFVEAGALDPGYWVHPFKDPLVSVAFARGFDEIARYLVRSLEDPTRSRAWGDTGKIDFLKDDARIRFQQLVDEGKHSDVEAMLEERPDLALDKVAFWGEGILCMPAKNGDRRMLELLMRHDAWIPELSKWGARYYFKDLETGKFLLEAGMNPNHMNWREFTLLHDMAFTGDVEKARLLLDHGADFDAIDDEYSSTPLGYAARWGNREIVSLLLKRGADPNKAGAPWATPLAWAIKKGHAEIETDLRHAGAVS